MKKLFLIIMMFLSLANFAQVTVNKTPFNLKGLSFIKPQSAIVKGVQEITLNFNEQALPVSTLQAAEFAKKTDNTVFTTFQKSVLTQQASFSKIDSQLLVSVRVLQDSIKSMSAQIATLKATKTVTPNPINALWDDPIIKNMQVGLSTLQKSMLLKADSSAIARLPELSFPDFNINGDSLHYTISNAPKRITLAQRLLMKNAEPGLEVWQMDGNKPGKYYFSKAINDWVFLYN